MNINRLHLPFCKASIYIVEEYIHFSQRFDERLYSITHCVTFRKLESKIKMIFFLLNLRQFKISSVFYC